MEGRLVRKAFVGDDRRTTGVDPTVDLEPVAQRFAGSVEGQSVNLAQDRGVTPGQMSQFIVRNDTARHMARLGPASVAGR